VQFLSVAVENWDMRPHLVILVHHCLELFLDFQIRIGIHMIHR